MAAEHPAIELPKSILRLFGILEDAPDAVCVQRRVVFDDLVVIERAVNDRLFFDRHLILIGTAVQRDLPKLQAVVFGRSFRGNVQHGVQETAAEPEQPHEHRQHRQILGQERPPVPECHGEDANDREVKRRLAGIGHKDRRQKEQQYIAPALFPLTQAFEIRAQEQQEAAGMQHVLQQELGRALPDGQHAKEGHRRPEPHAGFGIAVYTARRESHGCGCDQRLEQYAQEDPLRLSLHGRTDLVQHPVKNGSKHRMRCRDRLEAEPAHDLAAGVVHDAAGIEDEQDRQPQQHDADVGAQKQLAVGGGELVVRPDPIARPAVEGKVNKLHEGIQQHRKAQKHQDIAHDARREEDLLQAAVLHGEGHHHVERQQQRYHHAPEMRPADELEGKAVENQKQRRAQKRCQAQAVKQHQAPLAGVVELRFGRRAHEAEHAHAQRAQCRRQDRQRPAAGPQLQIQVFVDLYSLVRSLIGHLTVLRID